MDPSVFVPSVTVAKFAASDRRVRKLGRYHDDWAELYRSRGWPHRVQYQIRYYRRLGRESEKLGSFGRNPELTRSTRRRLVRYRRKKSILRVLNRLLPIAIKKKSLFFEKFDLPGSIRFGFLTVDRAGNDERKMQDNLQLFVETFWEAGGGSVW